MNHRQTCRITLPKSRVDQCVEATHNLNMSVSEAVTLMVALGLREFPDTSLSALCSHIEQVEGRS